MNSALNNIVIYNGYPLSVVVAVGIHIGLLVTLLYLQTDNRVDALELIQPTVIKSLFIDENPQLRNEKNIERRRLEQIEQQRVAREEEAARKQREAEQAAEQRRQEQERAEAAARAEERARQAALREREEVERQLAEQQRREREAEQQRERELAQAQQRREEEARARQAEQTRQAEAAAADAARTEFELVQSATGLIQQVVQENWSRPPSARNGMRVVLRIAMLPTGEVTDVTITQSSNDPAFDRAAETAVYRAAPFSELQSLPIKIFNENFRLLSLTFEPEDLLN